jgi:hypothetical protein
VSPTVFATPLGAVRALLWFSLGWGLFLVLLSFVMPIATLSSGYDGPQLRLSAFDAYGLVGLLPAVGILAAVVLTAGLLAFGRRTPSRTSLSLAEGVAALVFIVLWLAPLVLRLVGLLPLPLAISILAAALTSEVLRQLTPPNRLRRDRTTVFDTTS